MILRDAQRVTGLFRGQPHQVGGRGRARHAAPRAARLVNVAAGVPAAADPVRDFVAHDQGGQQFSARATQRLGHGQRRRDDLRARVAVGVARAVVQVEAVGRVGVGERRAGHARAQPVQAAARLVPQDGRLIAAPGIGRVVRRDAADTRQRAGERCAQTISKTHACLALDRGRQVSPARLSDEVGGETVTVHGGLWDVLRSA